MPTESQIVTWTVESNPAGAWALFVWVAGQSHQLSRWFESREDLLAAIRGVVEKAALTEES